MHRLGWIVVSLLVTAISGETPSVGRTATLYERVVATRIRIESPSSGQATPTEGAEFLTRLMEEATARAERTLLRQHVAGAVVRLGESEERHNMPLLTGVVQLPVGLPQEQAGSSAFFRNGTLATATVTLCNPDGRVLASGSSYLAWKDVRWVRGARHRRARPVAQVLEDAVRKATDHAVKQLRNGLTAERWNGRQL